MLRVSGRRCVVVGGGGVACRRAGALHRAGAEVVVVAAAIGLENENALMRSARVIHRRPYRRGDLDGAWLVVIATDDPAVNRAIAVDAQTGGVLVNRADDPSGGDFEVPAHAHHGPVTLAVHTGGVSASAAGMIRRELSAALDPDWLVLLEVVAGFRAVIQKNISDPRVRRGQLKALTNDVAMRTFKQEGPEAFRRYCQSLVDTNTMR